MESSRRRSKKDIAVSVFSLDPRLLYQCRSLKLDEMYTVGRPVGK